MLTVPGNVMQVLKVAYVLLSFFYVVTACAVFLESLAAVPRRRLRPVRDGLREVRRFVAQSCRGRDLCCARRRRAMLEHGRVSNALPRARCLPPRRSVGDPLTPLSLALDVRCGSHPSRPAVRPCEGRRSARHRTRCDQSSPRALWLCVRMVPTSCVPNLTQPAR